MVCSIYLFFLFFFVLFLKIERDVKNKQKKLSAE